MNIIELLSKNADIYDALADYHELDMVELQTPSEFIRALDLLIAHKNAIADASNEESARWNRAQRDLADLCMIRGFINAIAYLKTPQSKDDEFFEFIKKEANEYYNAHTDMDICQDSLDAFSDNNIRNSDDLSDNEEEFNTREYYAFDHALDLWESFNR